MNFEGDAFISYAHLDNVELVEGGKGWVTNLHRALEVRVAQLLGKPSHIWRDPKLDGNDIFEDALVNRLKQVAALISVVSPRYVKSEWTRRELAEFWKAAEAQGGVRFRDKARVFKVLKTPVPIDATPPELQSLLGYEFFRIDPDTGRIHELDEIFGPEAQREFWLRLDDLAHDICCMLEVLGATDQLTAQVQPVASAIFLAESTSDLREQREAIKRDLQQHGYTVLPSRNLPMFAPELEAALRDELARCRMSIHLIGRSYSFVPEASAKSLLEIQNELAIERGDKGGFSRLLWIPPALEVADERQRHVIERLRMDPRIQKDADLVESPLEDFRTIIQDRLKQAVEPEVLSSRLPATTKNLVQLYLIHDQRDTEVASFWADFLFENQIEVIRPVFEGDEAEIRDYHEENLRNCDAALILYGAATECWLRRKVRELQKSAGYGRTKPAPVVAISLIPPATPEKERFRTHEALLIPQLNGFSVEPLQPFISLMRA